jgi:hypothetical protein
VISLMILANAAQVGAPASNYGSISGELVIGIIGAIATGWALVRGKTREKVAHENGKREGLTTVEVQGNVNTKEHVELVTKAQMDERLDAMEGDISAIKASLEKDRDTARDSLGKVHKRLDTVVENQGLNRGELNGIRDNVARLLDLATKRGGTGR